MDNLSMVLIISPSRRLMTYKIYIILQYGFHYFSFKNIAD